MSRFRRWFVAAASFAVVSAALPATPAHAAGGTVTGRVTDASGAGLADVCVRLYATATYSSSPSASGRAGADGTYAVSAPAGAYLLAFADCGGRDLVTSFWPGVRHRWSGTPVTLTDGGTVSGLDGRLEQGGSVSGTVTDYAGTPMAGTYVSLRLKIADNHPFPTDEQIRTDADGRFTARGLPPGAYLVTFYPGSGPYAATLYGNTPDATLSPAVDVTAGRQRPGVDARLSRRGTISGVVKDDDGAPHEKVCVFATPSATEVNGHLGGSARTADDGTYTITDLGAGTYRVKLTDCGGVTAARWYPNAKSFEEGTPVTMGDGTVLTGIDGAFPRGLQISGTVRGQDETPLGGIGVAVYDGITGSYTGRGTHTDADGRYTLTGLRGTVYKLQFYGGGGQQPDIVQRWWPGVQTQSAALPVSLAAGVSVTDLDITLPKGGRILGRVTDSAGNPAHGVCVYAVNPVTDQSNGMRVDVTGAYALRALDFGAYRVFFRACGTENWAPHYYGGTDEETTAELVTVELEKDTTGIDDVVRPGGTITGTVRDTAGQPIAQACAYAYRDGGGLNPPGVVNTDENGRYTITALAPDDTYRVRFWDCYVSPARYVEVWNGGGEFSGDAPAISVGSGETRTANAVMERGGNFSGTVYDQFGEPLYGICVTSIDAAGRSRSTAFTGQSGTFNVGGLKPGTYRAHFRDCGAGIVTGVYHPDALLRSQARTFEVREGEETKGIDAHVTVVTTPKAPFDVRVSPGDGRATVSWQPPTDTGNSALTAFEVRDPSGLVVARAAGTAKSAPVTGLTNGTAYSFTVNAVNVKGAGDSSEAVSVVPRPSARLAVTTPKVVVSGLYASVTGRLTDAAGTGVVGARVELFGRRRGTTTAMSLVGSAQTSSTGGFWTSIRPVYPMEYSVRYAGTETFGSVAVTRVVPVSPRLTVARSGRTVGVWVSPAAGGGRARLQVLRSTGWVSVVGADLPSTGRVSLRAPYAGTWRVTVTRSGWATAYGPRLKIT